MVKAQDAVDERVSALLVKVSGREFPLTLNAAAGFFRAAYLDGYFDALHDDRPLTEEVPMLRYPQLFLP